MIQSDALPMTAVLSNSYLADVLEKYNVQFGQADEDVYDPGITLWAMISQFLFAKSGRSCKAAAGRVVSLVAQLTNRVSKQNVGNFCRAKAKMPVAAIKEMALGIAQRTEEYSHARCQSSRNPARTYRLLPASEETAKQYIGHRGWLLRANKANRELQRENNRTALFIYSGLC